MTTKEAQRQRAQDYHRQMQEAEEAQLQALKARQRKTRLRLRKIEHATREDQLEAVALAVEAAGLLWADLGWLKQTLADVATRRPLPEPDDTQEEPC